MSRIILENFHDKPDHQEVLLQVLLFGSMYKEDIATSLSLGHSTSGNQSEKALRLKLTNIVADLTLNEWLKGANNVKGQTQTHTSGS